MKLFILAFLLAVSISASLLDEHGNKFQGFKLEHGKIYMNQAEETKRFAIFRENIRLIEEHNALYEQGSITWKQRVTRFADMTREEFLALLGTRPKLSTNGTKHVKSKMVIPTSVDWRTKGQVTEIKNQGRCGSCWAFALTGSIEAAYYRKSGKLVSLSEQQLVDCSTINMGCSYGYLEQNFPYLQEHGLQAESDYPYTAQQGSCRFQSSRVVTKISSNNILSPGNEDELLNAVGSVGPVSILMDATYLPFYDSGVFRDNRCNRYSLNHAVLIVGYGSDNGTDHWIVKNSWGMDWGEKGYFKMLRGKNMCGVSEDALYPVIK